MKTNRNHFPNSAGKNHINAIKGLLIFTFFSNEFCLDLESLSEIRNVNETEININNSKEAVILSDNYEYKVIRMHKLLGYDSVIESTNNRVIFIDIFNKKIAFIVDMINEILTTETLFVEDTLSMEINPAKKYIKSVIKFQGRNIFLPDFEKISKEVNQLAIISGFLNRTKSYPEWHDYIKRGEF